MIILKILIILLSVLLLSSLLVRYVSNVFFDKKLNIHTLGTRSWGWGSLYNRTESTPYLALHGLLKRHNFNNNFKFIDFGCGKGRVAIFIAHYTGAQVTGIELMDETHSDLVNNVNRYNDKFQSLLNIDTLKVKAEEYVIKRNENVFFFFNPFNSTIFQKVINNIVEDSNENRKNVKIILYYPTKDYKRIMEGHNFRIIDKFRSKGGITPTEQFIIYENTLNEIDEDIS